MEQCIIQLITATLGSFGFSVLYNHRSNKLIIATLGGLFSWLVYLLLEPLFPSESIRYLISSSAITIYAEIFARVLRTPTTSFLVPSIIPLVPGRALYYTMNYALHSQWPECVESAMYTMQLALFIAVGIIAVTTSIRILHSISVNSKHHSVYHRR